MPTTSLIVSRSEIGLGPLELHDPASGYLVVGTPAFGWSGTEKTYPQPSPFADFDRPTGKRRSNGTYTLRILVRGSTGAQLHQRINALERAFLNQYEMPVSHTLDGVTMVWECIAADSFMPDSADGGLSEPWHRDLKQAFVIQGPHRGKQ